MLEKSNAERGTTDSPTLRRSPSARSPHSSRKSERGTALLETALTLPLLLLVSVSIFEFGRAYQTWQILTNAAREGARVAVLPNATVGDVTSRVTAYMQSGQLADYANATISVDQNQTINIGAGNASASLVTVAYPFNFMVLNPVARLVAPASTLGSAITLTATAEMRNEAQ
jgi:Flp pilus assembly protein TadG